MFGVTMKIQYINQKSHFCNFTWLFFNSIYLFENSRFLSKKCMQEIAFCIKTYVCGSLLALRICKLFSYCKKLLSRILLQSPHEISSMMFVLIKNLNLSIEHVQEKFYFSNIGQKNCFI